MGNSQRRNCKGLEKIKTTLLWYGHEGWNGPWLYMGL